MSPQLQVLIVEDNRDDCELIVLHLNEAGFDFNWQRVDNEPAYLQALQQPLDLILSDWNLPRFGGERALTLLKESGLPIPFVIVSGSIGEEAAIDALHFGADDYVLKDRPARLGQAARRALEHRKVRLEADQSEKQLRESEAKFRSIFENNHAVMLLIDPADLQIVDANPAACEYYGWSQAEITSHSISDINTLPPDEVQTEMEKAKSGDREYFQFQHRLSDGRVRAVEVYSGPIQHGGQTLLYSIIHDVTDRRQRERELEMIASMNASLRTASTRSEMLPAILTEMRELFNVESAALGLLSLTDGDLHIELGLGGWSKLTHQSIPTDQGFLQTALKSDQPILEADISQDAYLSDSACSVAAAPLLVQKQTIGLLLIGSNHPLQAGSLSLLASIADIAASALHRTTLFEQTEERLQQLSAMRTIDEAIRSSFDLQLILNVILSQITHQLHVDASAILLLNPHTLLLEYAAGYGFVTREVEHSHIRLGEGQVGRVALERRLLSLPDLDASHFTRRALLTSEGFVSQHAAPLIVKGNVRGVLEAFTRQRSEPDQEWLSFFEALAGQAAIAIDNARLFEELQNSNSELSLAYDNTIEGWSRALDLRDRETEGHTRRVAEITIQLASMMGVNRSQFIHMRRGALLHDIGKMAVSDLILQKPGPLTPEEWEQMHQHPQFAFDMLSPIHYLRPALEIPYCHHEKWDGSGYPRQLKGESIPLAARVFSVVDVWDALTSDRPYRKAWSIEQALDYIREQSGSHFDPAVASAFLELKTRD